ncbi:hypothetical protein C8J57DRAFT_167069 [Mycena rebaudengoi]|nr:hypothetical protein C8J57DRAFT_167069 [Mycena rebaudengoi]
MIHTGLFVALGTLPSLTPLLDPNPAVIAGGKADSLAHSGRDGGEDDDGDTLLDSDDEPIRLRAVQAPPDKEEGYTPPSPQSSMPADTTMESDQHPRYGTVNVRPRDGSDTHVVRTSSVEETVAPRMSRSPSSNLPPGAREPDLYPCYDSAPVGRRGGKEVLTPCSLQPCETMEGTAGIIRPRTRNASTDQLAMRSFALSMFAQSDGLGLGTPDLGSPPQYVEQRCFNTESQWDDQQHRPYEPRTTRKPDARSRYTQLNNVQHPTAQSFSSHCPDAPGMLPTPIASPLPSPLVRNASFIDPFTSTTPAGSPYPCPSNHVRRNHSSQNTSRASVSSPTFDANGTMHRSLTIQEQPVRQWQYNHSQSAVEEGASVGSFLSPISDAHTRL